MKWRVVAPLTAVAVCGFVLRRRRRVERPAGRGRREWRECSTGPPTTRRVLDAKLAGLKAGLKLTPDQEKLWGPFEAAVRDGAQMRMDAHARSMRWRPAMRRRGRMSPVDRLDAMADRLTEGAASLKKIADAAKPLYASLDDSQKHSFRMARPRTADAGARAGSRNEMMGAIAMGRWHGPR